MNNNTKYLSTKGKGLKNVLQTKSLFVHNLHQIKIKLILKNLFQEIIQKEEMKNRENAFLVDTRMKSLTIFWISFNDITTIDYHSFLNCKDGPWIISMPLAISSFQSLVKDCRFILYQMRCTEWNK